MRQAVTVAGICIRNVRLGLAQFGLAEFNDSPVTAGTKRGEGWRDVAGSRIQEVIAAKADFVPLLVFVARKSIAEFFYGEKHCELVVARYARYNSVASGESADST